LKTASHSGISASKATVGIIGIAFVLALVVFSLWNGYGVPREPLAAALLNAVSLAALLAFPVYWVVRMRLASERQRGLERTETSQLAITDTLTRIMNRRGITVSLLDAMAQAERYDTPLSVAMGDIDLFKRINETHGHQAGDKVLAHIASVFSDSLRMPDKVGRYGGEEFLVIFPHTGLAQARKIAERIRTAVQRSKLDVNRNKVQVTVSLGVTQFQKGEDLEQLLSRVDKAVMQAKAGGRNLVAAQKVARASE
jgi:diguanylate cyclase (GGDEF)-like protein